MELRPADAPLDPFFEPVRRRHRDVDIVVLPPQREAPAGEPLEEAQVVATLDRVDGAAARFRDPALGPARAARMGFGPDDGTVVASARAAATTTERSGVLAELREALEADGWRVRQLPGEVERVSGVREDLRVQASYADSTGALLVEVRSSPMYVGRARARELVRR